MAQNKAPMPHIEGAVEISPEESSDIMREDEAKLKVDAPSSAEVFVDVGAPVEEPPGEGEGAPEAADDMPSEPAQGEPKPTGDRTTRATGLGTSAGAWAAARLQGHEYAAAGGALGFVVAVAVFVAGFWETLFVCLMVTVGVALGQALDGDPKIIDAIRRLLGEGRPN